jgi:HEAT repeat protein
MKLLLGLILVSVSFAQAPATQAVSLKEQSWTYLTNALADKNPDTRVQAVQSLGLVGAREPYIHSLTAMLDDKDVQVRVATVTSLVDLKNKGTIPALKKALADDVPEVSFAASKALFTLKDPDGKEALVSVVSGELKTSSGFITKQKRDALRMLQTPKPLMMFAIKTGVGFAPVPGLGEGISSLQGILSDPGISGRAAAALLLAGEKDPQVLAALVDALQDKDGTVRAAACHAIALRNDKSLEKDLIPLLDDKKPAVKLRAAAGYLRLESLPAPVRRPASRTATPAKKPLP